MKKGYWVVAYRSISDESAVQAYAALAVPAVQAFGGRARFSPTKPDCRSGPSSSNSTAVTSHWRLTKARLTKRALQALGSGAERDYRIVEGV